MSGPSSSRTAYGGRLFDVVVEHWGEHEREIVEHPGSVGIVALDARKRLLLVRQLREPARRELLELPAGALDEGEEPLTSAKRELEEECGHRGGRWSELARFWSSPGFVRERMHLFLAEDVLPGEPRPEADESIELVHVDLRDLDRLLDELEDAKTIAGILLFIRRRPGMFRSTA